MKAMFWARITASVFVGLLVVCGGCGKSDGEQARETAQTFMSASANGDRLLMESALTKLAREKMQEGSAFAPNQNAVGASGYTIGTPEINGDSASVPVTVTKTSENSNESELATVTEVASNESNTTPQTQTETITLKLRREEGQWKIWAMRVPFIPGGSALTMDFEHPEAVIGDAFKGMGEGLGAAMKGMGEGLGAMFKGMAEGAKAAEAGANAAQKTQTNP